MKREMTFKSVLILVALFASTGIFAQTAIPGWDNGAGGDNYDTLGATWVTVGYEIPLYAKPDAYFHPTYDPITGNNLTAGFTWAWTSADAPANFTFGNASDNYVEVTGVNAGSYTVNVLESAPAAWGGCNDGTGRDITINVVDPSSLAYDAATVDSTGCDGTTFPAIAIEISDGYQAYRLAWTLEIKSTDAGGTETWYDDEAGTNPAALAKFAVEYTQAVPDAVANNLADYDPAVIATNAYAAIGGESTEYIYTLKGVNDQASRWSEFLDVADVNAVTPASFTYFDTADDIVTITVHPSPTTGPIFHIDATWAN